MIQHADCILDPLELLKPLLQGNQTSNLGKVVIGTVKGDLHDIGKNLVASLLEGCGFEVINLGIDISKERFGADAYSSNANEAVEVAKALLK